MRFSALISVSCLALAIAPAAIAQHEGGSRNDGNGRIDDMSVMGGHEEPAGGTSAWAELKSARDAIAQLLEAGKLAEIHNQAARLEPLGEALVAGAKNVPDDKRTRIEATLRQLPELGKTLDKAGDAGDVSATRRELKRLDGVIALIEAQYPGDVLPRVPAPTGMPSGQGHSERQHTDHENAAHAHSNRPLAAVDDAPKAILRVKSGEFNFAPQRLAMKAGEPTRIELENDGAIEHALIVAAPDGKGDWIHLHAMANASDAGTFRIDQPGKYRVLCTVPGHTEAGMVGELLVR